MKKEKKPTQRTINDLMDDVEKEIERVQGDLARVRPWFHALTAYSKNLEERRKKLRKALKRMEA